MKISLEWLREYIETGLDAEQIAGILRDLGLPCEGIETIGDNAVLDVEVTSNRGDCLSYIGIARELAAVTGKELKLPKVDFVEMDKEASSYVQVDIREPELCGRYTARVIEGVKVGPSPDWMVRRLEAAGMRSVSNVVDATNYAMLETGQPPHAFNYATLEGHKIIVRKAMGGERIVSIDGSQCDLRSDMLVIADARKPVAVAGVMGGLETEVGPETTTILLEDAWFDPLCVRTTARALGLPSEAAFRFERIVDIERIDWASRRTAQLMAQVAGGRIARGVVDEYPLKPDKAIEVTMRLSRLKALLGVEVPTETAVKILTALSFQPRVSDGTITCSVPSWRSDVDREVDVIEEVIRVYGYDKVPTRKRIHIEAIAADPRQRLAQTVRTSLDACGFYETVNVSFVDVPVARLFTGSDQAKHLSVKDVSRKNANLLRQTLMGSLLGVLKTNVNAKNLPCRIYEIADTFVPSASTKKGTLPTEAMKVGLVCDGDFRLLRSAVESVVQSVDRHAKIEFVPAELPWAQVGAQITADGRVIGEAGVFSDAAKTLFDFKDVSPCGAELNFEMLVELKAGPVKIRPVPRFPAVDRDLSILVPQDTLWADIAKAVKAGSPAELEDVAFVDIYRGKGIPAEKKSVTLSLRFRDEDGTLTHEAVDAYQTAILNSLNKTVGAELRTF
jgi:phenylalanyl-tRNA synthetase beta chain